MAAATPRLRYHCVSVVPGRTSCAAAQAIYGQRLLSAEAPRLPLANCETPGEVQMHVYRRHHDDRRAGPRRAVGHREEDPGSAYPR